VGFEKLKGVMIGAGYFAERQAEAWSRMTGAEITAVADLDGAKAGAFASRWSLSRVYLDAEEMLERERPDFVDIVTRPPSHLALVQMAAARGIHVICQKPMAPTWEESRAMVEVCAANRVRLIIHENWRWQPWFREVKRLLDQGFCGAPFYASFVMRNADGRGPKPYAQQPYFREMERLMVYEMAVHFIDTFRFLLGEITKVYCQNWRVNPAIQGEDCSLVQLTFEPGTRGLIDANRISGPAVREPLSEELIIEGDRARLRLARDERLWLTEYGGTEALHGYAVPGEGYRGDSVRAAQEHYLACLRSGAPCENDGADYLKTTAAVFACYRSAETGQAVKVN